MPDCSAKAYGGSEAFIFISYAHVDAHLVYPIVERLSMDGYRVWYDDGIHAGEDWTETVASRLDESSICLAMLTENSVASLNCRNEITYSLSAGKTLIALKLTDFEMPKGMRLQLGNTLYLERFRYGETEFYERLVLSHGVPSCRSEEPRITDEQLMAWRDKWANATPIREAKGKPEPPVLRKQVGQRSPAAPQRAGRKKLILPIAIAALCLVLLAVFLIPRLTARQAASDALPETAPEATPEAMPEPTVEPTAEPTPEPSPEDVWIDVPIQLEGTELQMLSCRYLGGPEIKKIDFHRSSSDGSSGYFYVYYANGSDVAAAVGKAWHDTDSECDLADILTSAESELSIVDIPPVSQNPLSVFYDNTDIGNMNKNDPSDYLAWCAVNSDGEIVSTVISEIGFPPVEEETPAEETYTVTYDANGGYFDRSPTVTTKDVVIPVSLPFNAVFIPWPETSEENMFFSNWFLDPECTHTASYVPREDITLYAGYKPCREMTLDGNGGLFYSNSPTLDITYPADELFYAYQWSGDLTHEDPDMELTGWYLDKACTQFACGPEDSYLIEESPATLYAGWAKKG